MKKIYQLLLTILLCITTTNARRSMQPQPAAVEPAPAIEMPEQAPTEAATVPQQPLVSPAPPVELLPPQPAPAEPVAPEVPAPANDEGSALPDFSSLFEHADEQGPSMPFNLADLEAQLSLVDQEAENIIQEQEQAPADAPEQKEDTATIVDEAVPERPVSPLLKDPDLYPQQEEKKDIHLNFEGAEMKSFIEYIADIRNMNIIPDKSIAGTKISLNFRNPVSRTGAWNTFLTILEMSNFSIVKFKNGVDREGVDQYIYRVIPKDRKLNQPLPTFIGVDPDTLPESDATIRYVAFLNNVPIQEVQPLLQSMLGQPHGLIPQQNVNAFIITDRSLNIKSAMKVVRELDQTGMHEEAMVIQLKRANAADVKSLFDSLIKKPEGNPLARLLGKQGEDSTEYFSPSTKIIAEERTNSLIMLGTKKSLEKVRSFIVEHIDKELKQAQSPLRVYELQHTSAPEIVEILREVTSAQNYQSQVGMQASKYGAIRGGVKFFKGMTFQADTDGNRLLVSCTDDTDWKLLQETIRRLDTPQPQVAIQMMIVTVSAKSVRELGGQMRNKTHQTLGKNVDFQTHPISSTVYQTNDSGDPISLLGNLLNAFSPTRGSSVLSFGRNAGGEGGLWAIFRALSTKTDASVISQPFLTAANRSSSTLVVGESTYITTQESVGSGSSTAGRSQENADTTITLTPQINMDGIIKLDVDAKIEEFVPDSGGTAKQTKKLVTSVTVANGQVIALGGFVKTKITESGGQTPILGSIPLLGWLAKNKKRNIEKEYVFLFLCPSIVKPRTAPGMSLYTKMKLHKAAEEVEDAIKTTRSSDPLHNWFFNSSGENYSHKVIDFANARYQPNNVDVRYDPFYRSESAIEKSRRLDIDNEAASPVEHWQDAKIPAAPKPAPRKPQPVAAQAFVQPPPATQPTGPEAVTLPSAPKRTGVLPPNPFNAPAKAAVPQPTTPAPAPQQAASPLLSTQPAPQMIPIQGQEKSAPSAAPVEGKNLDSSIEQRRAKLRSLLSGGSIVDLLSKAPPPAPEPAPENVSAQAEQPAPAGSPAPGEQKTVAASKPHEQASFMLSRRQGIKNLLSAAEEATQPQQVALNSAAASKGLQSFLESKA